MKKMILLLSALVITSCSKNRSTTGNPGAIPGNSDKKIYETSGTHEEEHSKENHSATKFHYDKTKTKLVFTAYKFPGKDKMGVNGTFKVINVIGAKDSEKAEEVLANASFDIPIANLSTNDVGRDTKIKNFFFNKMTNTSSIKGKFGEFKGGKVPIILTLNGKAATKEFQYQTADHKINLIGKIDIIKDFDASVALKSINTVCKALHAGKTWPDVDLKAEINFVKK